MRHNLSMVEIKDLINYYNNYDSGLKLEDGDVKEEVKEI